MTGDPLELFGKFFGAVRAILSCCGSLGISQNPLSQAFGELWMNFMV